MPGHEDSRSERSARLFCTRLRPLFRTKSRMTANHGSGLATISKPVAISFGSSNLRWPLARFKFQADTSGVFASSYVFTEHQLDAGFRSRHDGLLRKEIRGFGYWLWKPQAVLQALRDLPRGQLVAYLDLGCHVFRNPRFESKSLHELCSKSPTGIVVFQDSNSDPDLWSHSLERVWTKGDLFSYLGVRSDRSVTDTPQIAATSFIFVVGERSENFFREWLEVAEADQRNIDESHSSSANFPEFVEHRFDQSIFSILSKIRGSITIPQDLLQGATWVHESAIIRLPWVAARDIAGFFTGLPILIQVLARRIFGNAPRI